MAVNHAPDDYVLPCDRRLEPIWDRLDAGADSHERTCPHCQDARQSLLVLRAATRQLVDEPVTPPLGLTGRIMSAVRAELRRSDMVALPSTTGRIEVSEQAVAVVLRFAADQVTGVRARRCTVRTEADGVIAVELSVALRYGTGPVEDVVAEVRARVIAAAESGIGLRVVTCALLIEDLYS
jgi:uncharacterized alkaline shock family protein YloU